MTDNPSLGLTTAAGVGQTGIFGGSGAASVWNLPGRQPAGSYTAGMACELGSGGEVGHHAQQRDTELLIGLDAMGIVTVAGMATGFGPGPVEHVRRGTSIAVWNAGDAVPLRHLIVKATPPAARPSAG